MLNVTSDSARMRSVKRLYRPHRPHQPIYGDHNTTPAVLPSRTGWEERLVWHFTLLSNLTEIISRWMTNIWAKGHLVQNLLSRHRQTNTHTHRSESQRWPVRLGRTAGVVLWSPYTGRCGRCAQCGRCGVSTDPHACANRHRHDYALNIDAHLAVNQ